ncbi:MAG: RNA polymerase sigma factor [Clostridia bacterium]|nr:RNA polymerase sigma factor [Clostridia bacterium]
MDIGESGYRRYLDGDQSGFDDVMNAYHDNLIYFVDDLVHNLTVAEDIAADSFAELIIHPKRFKADSSLKTYLFSVARHKALDYIRAEAHHGGVGYDETLDDEADTTSLENSVIHDERSRRLHAALTQINKEYATVLYLMYFEGMDVREVAMVIKKNSRQVTNLIYRAKAALKVVLEREGLTDYDE